MATILGLMHANFKPGSRPRGLSISMHLNVPDIEGFDLDHAAVVEIHIKFDNVKQGIAQGDHG